MMNYKLAKQLKEAGFRVPSPVFPQVADKQGYTDTGDEILRDYYDYHKESWNYEGEHYFIPTLSELIEATKQKGRELSFDECNEQWGSKYNHDKGIFERDENGKVIEELKSPYQWEAKLEDWNSKEYGKRRCYKAGDEVVTFTGGKTPEEAVARLYIKLNEK